MSTTPAAPDDGTYLCSDKGLILPLTDESEWSHGFRIVIYLTGLIWCFLGVSILTGTLLGAMGVIISSKKTVKQINDKGETEEVEVRVWNDTVANLTLECVGSGALEIILSLVLLAGNGFESGDLGPRTIIGAAAFNLLMIPAICILRLPPGETRRIKIIKVFVIPLTAAVLSYVWLLVILRVTSPDIVELWEAILTFLCFPILVIIAYLIDKSFFCKNEVNDEDAELAKAEAEAPLNRKHVREFMKEVGKHPELDEQTIAKLLAIETQQHEHHSRAWYLVNASRAIAGRARLTPQVDEHTMELYRRIKKKEDLDYNPMSDLSNYNARSVVEFAADSIGISEDAGTVKIVVKRYGLRSIQHIVFFETFDGTADAGEDYVAKNGQLIFEPNDTTKVIEVEIIDDYIWEPDETFFVKLSTETKENAIIGKKSIIEVTIIDDDVPGILEFTKSNYMVKESIGSVRLPVVRTNGSDGKIKVTWKIRDIHAVNKQDYKGGKGTLIFDHEDREQIIEIPIVGDRFKKDDTFEVELSTPTGGAQLGRLKKTIVTIQDDVEYTGMLDRVVRLTNINLDRLRLGNDTYAEQFREDMSVNGGDLKNAKALDFFMHFLTLGFKVIFATVPPPNFLSSNGWITFLCTLGFITILATIIADLASIFGCLVNLLDSVNAMTFVAIGASIPEILTSSTAAVNERTADTALESITICNVVSVFLGLGMPWFIAASYWASMGDTFVVAGGGLSFSIATYTVCAILCIIILMIRRSSKCFGFAELGGPKTGRYISASILVLLWVVYVLLSALYEYGYINIEF